MVTALILRCVVFSVNICADNARGLNGHVIERSGNGTRTHSVRVTGVPTYLDWMGYKTEG